jgi:hypothetical protein
MSFPRPLDRPLRPRAAGLVAVLALATVPGHANAPIGHFLASNENGIDVLYDVRTTLRWQQAASTAQQTWLGAQTSCAGLGPGWRLPSVEEQQTLIDDQTPGALQIDPAFGGSSADYYWTLTPVAGVAGSVWVVGLAVGSDSHGSDATATSVARCVNDLP